MNRITVLTRPMLAVYLALALTVSAVLPTAAQAVPQTLDQPRLSRHLADALAAADEKISFLVIMRDQLDLAALLAGTEFATRDARLAAVYTALTEHATTTQTELRAWLDDRDVVYRPYYVANMLAVTGDQALADALLARADVDRLENNPVVYQLNAVDAASLVDGWLRALLGPTEQTVTLVPWGLARTEATDVWALGYTGQGIVVASQDTGVEWTHSALQPRYRGWDAAAATVDHRYNWLDAWNGDGRPTTCAEDAQIPCDDHGHGTHTVGTMLGNATSARGIVGMAPDAGWIGCRNMRQGFGTPGSYAACFEFFLAPYPQGGEPFSDGRPELAPHIINNSWGCPSNEGCDADTLFEVVNNVRAAGIMVVSSAGNFGFGGCETVQDPIAIYDATFSIGAHEASGAIASFSSRGPVTVDASGRPKPDLTAPGVGVESATLGNGYATLQGTSMASPHVAGAVALLWSAAPELIGAIDATEQLLLKSATPVPTGLCTAETAVVPNNVFGFGRLNALAAVEMALAPFTLDLTVTDVGGDAAAGTLELTDRLTGYLRSVTLGAEGHAILPKVYAGEYEVELVQADSRELLLDLTLVQDGPGREGGAGSANHHVDYRITPVTDARPPQARLYLPLVVR